MGGTIQDWRADLVSDGYGNLDPSPRAKMRMRLERCQFTRPGIAEAVRIVAQVDGVRVMSCRGKVVVAVRMDHEYSPGGKDRAMRLADVGFAINMIRPAGVEAVVVADHVDPELRTCGRCGAVLADDWGDVPNRGACQGCAWALHCDGYARQEILAKVTEILEAGKLQLPTTEQEIPTDGRQDHRESNPNR